MSLLEKALNLMENEGEGWVVSLWPILGPLFVLISYSLAPHDLLIFGTGILGLLLATRWQVRGFFYALVLLSLTAILQHAFFVKDHLWQLGLQGAYAMAFFITALSSQHRIHFVQSLSKHIDAGEASIRNIEEEMTKNRDLATAQQIAQQEKIADLQRQIEEGQTEYSSVLVLNEVLRKTTAIHLEEKEGMQQMLLDAEFKMALLEDEREKTEIERGRLCDTEALISENRELLDALNGARLEKEQTRLISETLVREHAKENVRAKEANEKWLVIQEENIRLKQEVQGQHQLTLQRLEVVQTERNFLKERLEKATQLEPVSQEELTHLQERVTALVKYESLYKQLKLQFEEKNALLHQTRSELFKADTELETVRMAKEQKELQAQPFTDELREIASLTEELSFLEVENKELQDLITTLVNGTPDEGARPKKKRKMKSDQNLLF